MKKKFIVLCFIALLVLPLTACKRQYDMTYSPEDEEYAEQYVWASEKYGICLLNTELGTVGQMIIDGKQIAVVFRIIPGYFEIREYGKGYFSYDPPELTGIERFLGKSLIYTYQPKYKEGEFTIRVPLEQGQLYAGKKITFTRYEKDTVQPSDFGFDFESWDDLTSQFELVDYKTGETVSLDVLK